MEQFGRAKVDIADKVRKLLAKAEDPAASAMEAESLVAKAQELISRYSISEAMLAGTGAREELAERTILVDGPYARRRMGLVFEVAGANQCRSVWLADHKRGYLVAVVGQASDVEWTSLLHNSLDFQLASALARDSRHRPTSEHGRTWVVNYIQGFIGAVRRRLVEAMAQAKAAEERHQESIRTAGQVTSMPSGAPASPSVELALIAKGTRVEEEFRVRYPRTRTRSVASRGSESGRAAGAAAGCSAKLGQAGLPGSRGAIGA